MKNKVISLNVLFFLISILFIGCGKNDEEIDPFVDDISEIVALTKSTTNKKLDENNYKIYKYQNNSLNLINYNSISNGYMNNTISENLIYNMNDGIIIESNNGNQYLSFSNNKYCAVKNFDENELTIYNIENEENCHLNIIIGNDYEISLFGKALNGTKIFNSGDTANEILELNVLINILDDYQYSRYFYRWFRDGKEIVDADDYKYIINLHDEDAEYYVEVTTTDGKVITSEPFHVVIQNNEEVL